LRCEPLLVDRVSDWLRTLDVVSHDLATVIDVQEMLAGERMPTWIFGGWAEELRGLVSARPPARPLLSISCCPARASLIRTT
jgi:hypothetical protein